MFPSIKVSHAELWFKYLWVISRAVLHNSETVYFGLCWLRIQHHDRFLKWMHILFCEGQLVENICLFPVCLAHLFFHFFRFVSRHHIFISHVYMFFLNLLLILNPCYSSTYLLHLFVWLGLHPCPVECQAAQDEPQQKVIENCSTYSTWSIVISLVACLSCNWCLVCIFSFWSKILFFFFHMNV